MYSISAIIISCIFAFVAILVLLASIGMIAMMFGILFALLLDALPSRTTGRIQGFAVKFFALTFVTAFATLFFAVLIMFTSILLNIGRSLVGEVPILMMMWAAVAPILSIVMLHLLFVSWFKMPSPVTPSGAQAWAKGMSTGNLMNAAGAMSMMRGMRNQGDGNSGSGQGGIPGGGRGDGTNQSGQGGNATDQMTPAGSGQSSSSGQTPSEIDQAYAGLQKAGRDQAASDAREKALAGGMTPQAAEKSAELAAGKFDKSAAAMGTKAEAKAANKLGGGIEGTRARGRIHTLVAAPMKNAGEGYQDWKAGKDAAVAAADGSRLKIAGAHAGAAAKGAGRLAKSMLPAGLAVGTGAFLGTLVAPGVGTMAGAAIGGGLARARGYAKDRAVINEANLKRERENIGSYRAAQVAKANGEDDGSQLPPAPAQGQAPAQAVGQRAPTQSMPAAAQQAGGQQAAPALPQTAPPKGTKPAAESDDGRQQPGKTQQQTQSGQKGSGSSQQGGSAGSAESPTVAKKAVAPNPQQSGAQQSGGGQEQVSPAQSSPAGPPSRPQTPPPPAPPSQGAPPTPPR
jgi:hypothetical protein